MSELFEPVDPGEIPGCIGSRPHHEYAVAVMDAFAASPHQYVHLVNVPKFRVTQSTLLQELRFVGQGRRVKVLLRDRHEIYLVKEEG